ncbi:MAG: translation initiation factor IF-2 [Candidatus Omnitrophota bacterium]
MKVAELAKEFKVSTEDVLDKLRSMKLKAKDGDQELSKALLVVIKSELIKDMKSKSRQKAAPKTRRRSARPAAAKAEEKKKSEEKPETETAEQGESAAAEKKKSGKKTAESEKSVKEKKKAEKLPEATGAEQPAKETVQKEEPAPAEKAETAPEKSAPEKPVKKTHSGKDVSKTARKKTTKVSDQPFIPLKPFNKKKKKKTDARGQKPAPVLAGAEEMPQGPVGELKPLEIKVPLTVKDFANAIEKKTSVVLQTLIRMGVFANINQVLDEEVVRRLSEEFGFEYVQAKSEEEQLVETHREEEEDPSKLSPRAPVITFMGHVDHGKTSLLDRIRESKVVDQEHGGITQHIAAYSVSIDRGKITFLDTPGHAAFTAMRGRGAHITDIVVLVIAADEGIKPQTEEAIAHAKAAEVPLVVALNKMDRPGADPDKVKQELMEKGLTAEDWGGDTIVVPVSAMTGEGIDQLLEMILLESEMLELKANEDKKALGIVVEAHLSQGRGAVATLIVQSGTLSVNDYIVAGAHYGKIKAMFDDHGRPLEKAGPSTPVEILGLMGVPEAGALFYAIEDEKQAKNISERRQEQIKDKRFSAQKRITLEDLYSQIQEGEVKELNVILKADVQGSLEALKDSLAKIPSDEVKVNFVHAGVGDVNASDVILAVASNAIIIGFHVGVGPRAAQELEKTPVDVRQYTVIYDAVNEVRDSLSGMLKPKIQRTPLGQVEVRQVFKLSKSGMVAGCFVTKGKVHRKDLVDVLRDGEIVHTGAISTLKRFKDDVREVAEGYECGLTLERYDDLQEGDLLDVYTEEEIARTL